MTKVRAGFFSFTEITGAEHHAAYNEWHQLDHMPEQFPIPGLAYGQRWVCTPACRAAATVVEAPFDRVHYVTLYLMAEPLVETLRTFYALGRELHTLDRFFEHRHSHFARPLAVEVTTASPRVLISDAAVPYRPHRGVHVAVETNVGIDTPDGDELEARCALPGVAGAWSFVSSPAFDGLPWTIGDHRVTVTWIDGDLLDTTATIERHRSETAASDRTVFAAPFEVIVPWQWNWFDEQDGAQ